MSSKCCVKHQRANKAAFKLLNLSMCTTKIWVFYLLCQPLPTNCKTKRSNGMRDTRQLEALNQSVLFQYIFTAMEAFLSKPVGQSLYYREYRYFQGLSHFSMLEFPNTYSEYCSCFWLPKSPHGPELMSIFPCSSPRMNSMVPLKFYRCNHRHIFQQSPVPALARTPRTVIPGNCRWVLSLCSCCTAQQCFHDP